MEVLQEIGLSIGGIGVYAVVFVLVLLVVLLPLSAYSTQRWMYKTYLETKSINAKLNELLELASLAQSQGEQLEDDFDGAESGRREPTIGKDLNIPL